MSFTPSRPPRPSLIPGGFGLRLIAMLGALALIGATIYTLRSQFLAAQAAQRAEKKRAQEEPESDPRLPWTETVVSGPTDEDPLEREDARRFFEVVDDGEKLHSYDMPAYWKFVKWSQSSSTGDLEKRAQNVPFVKMVERPALHRGELVRLKLHVVRVLKYADREVPENSMGVKTLYELWGWTDDSMDYPLSVIVSEIPPGIPIGTEVTADAVFVGYFLKLYDYESAGGKRRRAPLLIGRVRQFGGGSGAGKQLGISRATGLTAMLVGGGVLICVVVLLVSLFRMTRGRRRSRVGLSSLPDSTVDVESWLERGTVDDPDGEPTVADRYSPAIATNGRAHHQNGEPAGESGDFSPPS